MDRVLIVAKCIVNEKKAKKKVKESDVLIVAKCIVNENKIPAIQMT